MSWNGRHRAFGKAMSYSKTVAAAATPSSCRRSTHWLGQRETSMNELLLRMTASALVVLSLLGCRPSFGESQAVDVVGRIGADILRAFADGLEHQSEQYGEIPRERWDRAIYELEPKSVYVRDGGVWITLRGFFVEAEGLLIVFANSARPEEKRGDPSIIYIDDRIYWFRYTG